MRRESMESASEARNRGAGAAPRTRTPLRARAAGIALRIAIALAIALVLGEVAVRVTGFVDRVNPFPRHLYVATDIPDLAYRLRPGVAVDLKGGRVVVNGLGMRDRADVARAPAPGVERILVVGDSVAFGWEQEAERAFPRQLEVELNRRREGDGGARPPVEVLNGGVPGYNAVNEAAWFRELGAALAPRTVVVAVNLNDYDSAPHLNGLGVLSMSGEREAWYSPANWSELYLAYRWLELRAQNDPSAEAAPPVAPERAPAAPPVAADAAGVAPSPAATPAPWHRLDRYVSNLRKRFYAKPTEPAWSALVGAWRDLAARARAQGARIVFVLFPDGDQIGVAEPNLAPQERLLELCRQNGFECLDLTPVYRAASGGEALYADIMHPSDAGHALAAGTVADYLRP